MTTSTLAGPSWGGVAASLLLVAVAAAVAYRQRLRLTREIVAAGVGQWCGNPLLPQWVSVVAG